MIAEEIKRFISELNLTDLEASLELGVAQSTLSQYLSGERNASKAREETMRTRMALCRARKAQGNTTNLAKSTTKRRAPVVSWALAGEAAGRGYFEDLANQIDQTVETISRDPNVFAVEISGDSMEPTASPNDVVVFEPNMEPSSGMPVLVKLIDGRVFFKRLYRMAGKIILQSDNEEYRDMEFTQAEIAFIYPARDIHRNARSKPRRI